MPTRKKPSTGKKPTRKKKPTTPKRGKKKPGKPAAKPRTPPRGSGGGRGRTTPIKGSQNG